MSDPGILVWLIPLGFAVFFPLLWLGVTALIGGLSGWYGLMARFPDRDERPMAQFRWQSGFMGPGVRLNNILTLAACPSGLRIGMWRVFGVFSRPFLVPWRDLKVERRPRFYGERAVLVLGEVARLEVAGDLADKLARAAGGVWPERR